MTPTPPDDTALRILACARDLFVAEGLAGVSMRKVAAAAGLSATAIYRHYQDREALLFALAEEGFRRFTGYLMAGLEGADPRDRLLRTGEGYLRFALDNPDYYRVIFLSDTACFHRLADQVTTRFSPSFQLLLDRVRECQEAGVLRAGEPRGLALIIWAQCHGLVALWLDRHLASLSEPKAFAAFFRDAVQSTVDGLHP